MRVHVSEILGLLSVLSILYSAGIGDGGGPWSAMIGFALLGVVLMGAAYLIERGHGNV